MGKKSRENPASTAQLPSDLQCSRTLGLGPHSRRCQHWRHAPPNPMAGSRRYHLARGRHLPPQCQRHPMKCCQHLAPLWPMPPPAADGRLEPLRHDSCHKDTTFSLQDRNRRSGNGVNRLSMPYAYWVDTSKKDQGQAILEEGAIPPRPEEDGPAIMDATAPAAGESGGT
jgi:hypothetical protein